MPKYVTPEELKRMVLASKKANTLTPELVEVLQKIVEGLAARFHYPDAQEVLQECYLVVLQKLHLANCGKNLFNWLTTIARNLFNYQYRRVQRQEKIIDRYIRDRADEIPRGDTKREQAPR